MSVDIEAAAQSMPESLDSLKVSTPPAMHRVYIAVPDHQVWYRIMQEARSLYGTNWRSQSRVRKRLTSFRWENTPQSVWFDVPEEKFGTWVAIKYGVAILPPTGK